MPAGKITHLRAQVKDSQRVNMFIDYTFALGVSLNTIAKAGLFVGKELSEEEYARIEQLESADKAFQVALRLLEARPRSTAEVRERLAHKDFAPEAVEAAVGRLAELEMLDDAAFARMWVENRQSSRPRGVNALRDELRRKGIDPGVAAAILSDDALTGDEAGRALTLARGALHKYAGSRDRNAFARRMGSYLQRRGFGFDVVHPIVNQLWSEIQTGASDVDEDQQDT